MNTPAPAPAVNKAVPSASTAGSTVGAFIATTVILIFDHYGIDFPAGYEAGMAAFFTTVAGYIPDLFRK